MTSTLLCAVTLLACALTFSAAQAGCRGRCGAEYYRGSTCQCDYTCLSYDECCKDYESQCTTKNSCKGRCGETFRRGRLCSCDSDCIDYKQCCPDYKKHCDAEEEISGAASATAPVKTNSCDNVNDNKPKEPTLNEATEQPSTFSEGNNADDHTIPLVSPTSYPQDDLSDDMYSQIFPNDGTKDPEASPIPESTSGYGSYTDDLLDHISTEPTQDPDTLEFSTETFTVLSQTPITLPDNEPTRADDSTLYPTIGEAYTERIDASSSDPGTTPPRPTTSQPTPTSETQTGDSPTAQTPELETTGQAEVQPEDYIFPEAQNTDLTVAYSDEPEATTLPLNTASDPTMASISTGPTQGSSIIPSSSMLDTTPIPEATTSNPGPDDTENNAEEVTPPSSQADLEETSISVSPAGSRTIYTPTSTDAVQDDATEDVTPPSSLADLTDTSISASPAGSVTTLTPTSTDAVQDDATEDVTPPSSLADLTDTSISASPAGSVTTLTPTSTDAVQDDTTEDVTPGRTTAGLPNVTPDPTEPTTSEATSKPQDKPDPYKPSPAKPTLAKPSSKPDTKPLDTAQTPNIDDPRDYQADDSNDTNLCSGRPVSAVTTLRNGTIVVFRGHYFWFLDAYRVPGPALGITQVWGVPSPIDTVFTRCNCQGKTYIFKGAQYWRFENDVLDRGYPKVIETGFDGLRGHVTAALSVPQHQRRRESVYFFKRGGLVQKYSYQLGTSQTCGRKTQSAVYAVRNRFVRQAVSLGPAVSIRTSWRGFPSTITAAVSVPSIREPEGYKYYVFSRSKSYTVRMDSERPVIAAPAANASPQSNSLFKCSKKV